jgi:hypothetical protein
MALGLSTLINGERWGWNEVSINIDGVEIKDIVAVEYGEEQDKELDYGAGDEAKGVVRGRIKCMGKITLNTEIVQMLRIAAAPYGGRISKLKPFLIVVKYQTLASLPIITHKLLSCEFKKDEVKWKEGDKSHNQELDLIIRKIGWL